MVNIEKLLYQKENRKLEFKQTLPTKDKLIKTAIAFSNAQGGDLIIGVDDKNNIIGIEEEQVVKYEEIISNTIYDNCTPTIIAEIFSVGVNDKLLLIVHFYPSSQKPHFIKSIGKHKGTFIRVGSSNRVATLETIEELERQKRHISYDSIVVYDEEYNKEYFDTFDRYIVDILKEKPSLALYEKLKLVKKEQDKNFLTNLGIWFSEKKDDYFPYIKIECARFKGITTKEFLD